MMYVEYQTQGTCATSISFEVEEGIITSCSFHKGCPGNTMGLGQMVVGTKLEETIEKLSGIVCRNGTSCPDQLAKALRLYMEKTKKEQL